MVGRSIPINDNKANPRHLSGAGDFILLHNLTFDHVYLILRLPGSRSGRAGDPAEC
jgi:hypothetical protein